MFSLSNLNDIFMGFEILNVFVLLIWCLIMDKLDNLDFIFSIDKSGMSNFLEAAPQHYEKAIEIGEGVSLKKLNEKIEKVVFLGMGGSSIGGSLLKDWGWNRVNVPIEVCRDSVIPKHVDSHSLVFAVSYSGDTHETLSAFLQALDKGCFLIGLSSGGLLKEYCQKRNLLHVSVPTGLQPRLALPYLFTPPAIILEKIGVLNGIKKEIEDAVKTLKNVREKVKASTATTQNESKKIALKVYGTLPIVYGFRGYGTVAYRLKTQLNENSKTFCKFDVLPELNHNEVEGWEGIRPSIANLLSVILLRDYEEPEEAKIKFEILKDILKSKINNIQELYGEGNTILARMLSAIYIGDYLSFYLAILNRIDPTPVDNIDFVKNYLARFPVVKQDF